MKDQKRIVLEEYAELWNGYFPDDEVEIIVAPHSTVKHCTFRKVIIRKHPKYKKEDYVTYYVGVGYIPNAVLTQSIIGKVVSKEIPIQIVWNCFATDEDWANGLAIFRQQFPKEGNA